MAWNNLAAVQGSHPRQRLCGTAEPGLGPAAPAAQAPGLHPAGSAGCSLVLIFQDLKTPPELRVSQFKLSRKVVSFKLGSHFHRQQNTDVTLMKYDFLIRQDCFSDSFPDVPSMHVN